MAGKQKMGACLDLDARVADTKADCLNLWPSSTGQRRVRMHAYLTAFASQHMKLFQGPPCHGAAFVQTSTACVLYSAAAARPPKRSLTPSTGTLRTAGTGA